MMGLQPSHRQAALFTYRTDLDSRVGPDHLLRRVAATLDLEFVPAAVRHCYGRSGHVSLDPRLVMKLLLLLFLYNIPSERELMEQVGVRLDFLWFLGLDLESDIPDHSVLSKARRRWGEAVFEQLFVRMVEQCVAAGLVEGRLLHIDSTMVRAQAHRDSVVSSGPELVAALRRAYQQQQTKLEVVVDPPETAAPSAPAKGEPGAGPEGPAELAPELRVLPASAAPPVEVGSAPAQGQESARGKLPVNATHLSTTDPEAELARSKNGRTELNYKHHRLVDDAHGVITAVQETPANVADGSQLPVLYEQHQASTGLKPAQVTVAGDHHYGTADNYLYCARQGVRAHLGECMANVEARGKLPASQFTYLPEADRLRCPQGHELVLHQHRPEEHLKVYLIEDAAHCAQCPLRGRCTESKAGRSIRRHLQAEGVEAARRQANSPAGWYSRKRRQHVVEGSFADAVNNHGARKARWRGLWRQRIQSWLIATVQNLRILLRRQVPGAPEAAAIALAEVLGQALVGCLGTLRANSKAFGERNRRLGPLSTR